ncbi:MAG TPA: hypothetical protein VE987_11640 [Polyangiaceae bacterium]|nr:hypothetical protein [Polyangiaceae bacterium]
MRLASIVALTALVAGTVAAVRAAYLAVTDAWVAPLVLSPDSRDILALRMQEAKARDDRGRMESDLASAAAEIAAIDVSLDKLVKLQGGYANAIRWSTNDRGGQLEALSEQRAMVERQRAMMAGAVARDQAAVDRAERNLGAGVIRAADLDQARAALARSQVELSEKELEYARSSAALDEATRAMTALARAATPAAGARAADHASPDVVRFDEVRINIELQVARLQADRRAAEARQRAARESLESLDKLREELESTPQYQAFDREMDLAFVPNAHLAQVHPGDGVHSCRWLLFDCREVGRVKRTFPGEVVTDDPWGSLSRGRYVELELSDPSAVIQRTLRVRERRVRGPESPAMVSR